MVGQLKRGLILQHVLVVFDLLMQAGTLVGVLFLDVAVLQQLDQFVRLPLGLAYLSLDPLHHVLSLQQGQLGFADSR